MALSLRAKRGLIAFGLFDVAVIAVFILLFNLKSEINLKDELREIGVTVYPDIRPVQEFELVDENFGSFTSEMLKDQWTLLFFGFTSCPDICPITMTELTKFYEQLDDPSIKDDLNIVMVSVDPERDDPKTIGNYVNGFNEKFLGVTGDVESISEVASQFFVAYSEPVYQPENQAMSSQHDEHQHGQSQQEDQQTSQQTDHQSHQAQPHAEAGHSAAIIGDNYLISHSGHIAIVNPDGNYHGVMRPPHRARDLLKAYKMIRDSSGF